MTSIGHKGSVLQRVLFPKDGPHLSHGTAQNSQLVLVFLLYHGGIKKKHRGIKKNSDILHIF